MRLSKKTRYGVRMMLELALNYGKGYIFLKDLARRQEISDNYLSQIALALKSRGLVISGRGAKGGHMLSRPPAKITIKDIVDTLEGDPGIVECVNNPAVCSRYPACVVADFWRGLEKVISDELSSTTLADLVKKCGTRRGRR